MTGQNGKTLDWVGVTPKLSVGEVFARRYQIEALLSQDLYGSIYRAKHTRYGNIVALKIFHPFHIGSPDDFSKIRANFDKAKAITLPGAARYLEIGEVESKHYVTMDLVDGKSLRQLLDEYLQAGMVLSLKEAQKFIVTILDTLILIHSTTTHRNISPSTIILPSKIKPGLMGETSDIKIIDFALVEVSAEATGDLGLAPAEDVAYSAPEIIRFGNATGPSVDVYAVAAVFYEMLTGRKHLTSQALLLPSKIRRDIPAELDSLFELCLTEAPGERLQTLTQMRERLASMTLEAGASNDIQVPARTAPKVLLAMILGLGLAGTWWATRPEELSDDEKITDARVRLVNEARQGAIAEPKEVLDERRKAAPKGMAYIPAGSFLKGFLPGERNTSAAEPAASVVTMPGYYIDRYKAPNVKTVQYEAGKTWFEAEKACKDQGKRLCSADEFERACKGPRATVYPYGDEFKPGVCATTGKLDATAGQYTGCTNEYQVFDMAGGLFEWTATVSPQGDFARMIKAGFLVDEAKATRCSFATEELAANGDKRMGYRCCADVGAVPASPPPPGDAPPAAGQ